MQIDDNALVTRNTDGTYHITLGYAGYSIYEKIWIVNPDKNKDMLDYLKNKNLNFNKMPFGLRNAENTNNPEGAQKAEDCIVPDNYNPVFDS